VQVSLIRDAFIRNQCRPRPSSRPSPRPSRAPVHCYYRHATVGANMDAGISFHYGVSVVQS